MADHPESQATERTTVEAEGASTRICSDFVELDTTPTGKGRPVVVEAEIGAEGVRKVNTA